MPACARMHTAPRGMGDSGGERGRDGADDKPMRVC